MLLDFTGQRDSLMEYQMNLLRQDPKSYLSDVDALCEEKQSVLDERLEIFYFFMLYFLQLGKKSVFNYLR